MAAISISVIAADQTVPAVRPDHFSTLILGHGWYSILANRQSADAYGYESSRVSSRGKALTYTVGRNVIFGAGQHMPCSLIWLQLVAHELTHVVQQSEKWRSASKLELEQSHTLLEGEAASREHIVLQHGQVPFS
jgi:hypothetical protein